MKPVTKFKLTVIFGTLLCVLALGSNVALEYFLPDIEGYIKRRVYYERVISKKGLSMHRAEYWKEKVEPERK